VVASHILGFANRDPTVAARNAAGHAYLIVGAEAGAVGGVEAIDSAHLDDGVARFCGGADGPGWEPDYVELDGRHVLVVTVDPPREGDPIWPLRKTYTDPGGKTQHDGRIFIRRRGLTVGAPSSAEIDMLTRRSRAQTGGLDLEILLAGSRVAPIDLGEEARERWLARVGTKLLRGVPERSPAEFVSRTSMEEQRTPEGFRGEVDHHLGELAAVFPRAALADAVEAGLGLVRLKVSNRSQDNFSGLLVELEIPAGFEAFFDASEVREGYERPKPPRPYGTSRIDFGAILNRPAKVVAPLHLGTIERGATLRVRFQPFDLRPGYTTALDPLYLIPIPERPPGDLLVGWIATSTNVSGSARGELTVPVDPEPVAVAHL
jgi:hypothetical protein